MDYYAESEIGLVRNRNEDAYLALPEQGLFAVADGMGGHQRGDVAAQVCLEAIKDWFMGRVEGATANGLASRLRNMLGLKSKAEADLLGAVEFANRLVVDLASGSEALRGMGTTLVAAYFYGSMVFVVYSGDSRIYRVRAGRLKQMSVDHSLLNEYIRRQMISPEEARDFPYKNVIMKAIGLSEHADVDFFRRRVRPGDIYLLCSDGLTDLVPDQIIREALVGPGSLQEKGRRLVELALKAGGTDNITVLLVRPL